MEIDHRTLGRVGVSCEHVSVLKQALELNNYDKECCLMTRVKKIACPALIYM